MAKELREAFRLYDKEGNGFIPTSCLKEILRELDDQLTDDDLNNMIDEVSIRNTYYSVDERKNLTFFPFLQIDSDGSGTVDFDGKSFKFCST